MSKAKPTKDETATPTPPKFVVHEAVPDAAEPPEPARTGVRISKDLGFRLKQIAAHYKIDVQILADQVLTWYADLKEPDVAKDLSTKGPRHSLIPYSLGLPSLLPRVKEKRKRA